MIIKKGSHFTSILNLSPLNKMNYITATGLVKQELTKIWDSQGASTKPYEHWLDLPTRPFVCEDGRYRLQTAAVFRT